MAAICEDPMQHRFHEGTDVAEAVVERRRRHPQDVGSPQIREDVRLLEPSKHTLEEAGIDAVQGAIGGWSGSAY